MINQNNDKNQNENKEDLLKVFVWSIIEAFILLVLLPGFLFFLIFRFPVFGRFLSVILWAVIFVLIVWIILNGIKTKDCPLVKSFLCLIETPPKNLYKLLAKLFNNKFIILSFVFKENEQIKENEQKSNIVDYIFLLRVPIISGLILFYFPIIAQFIVPNILQNVFVMDNEIQLSFVILFTTLSSISIVSLIKDIMVIKDCKLNKANRFRNIRTVLGILLVLPIWLSVLFNSVIIPQWTKGLIYFGIGMVLSIVLFLIFIVYDYSSAMGEKYKLFQRIIDASETLLDSITKPFLARSYNKLDEDGKIRFRRILEYATLLLIGLIFYGIAIYLNWPKSIKQEYQNQAPALFYILLIIWILSLLIGGITFYFDKYTKFNIPVILLLILFSGLSYGAWEVDHYFKLQNSDVTTNYEQDFTTAIANRLCPEDFAKQKSCNEEQSLVVVAASGGGIQASGWTAEVLAGLQEKIGQDFTKSIGLISSASGGSVGTMFYLDKLENGILQNSEEMIKNATDDWLDSVAWGLAFPDLLRLVGYPIAPLVRDGIYLDRGYSLEKDWQRTLTKPNLTLDDWYKKALNGEIPIPVFNSTIVENGRRFLISPMKFIPGEMKYYADPILLLPDMLAQDKKELSEEEKAVIKQSKAFDFRTLYHNCGNKAEPLKAGNKPCTIDVTTAARLSATFPYVSPMARNDINNKLIDSSDNEIKDKEGKTIIQNYHMADGGYFDNAGAFTALEWLDRLLEKNNDVLKIKKVVLIQINAFPEDVLKTDQIGEKGFLTVGIGPFTALNGVRNSTQIARNIEAVKLIKNRWKNKVKIQQFAFTFPEKDEQGKEYNQPLSWRLTQRQKNNLKDAWKNDQKITETVECLRDFWNKGQMNKECDNFS